MGELTSTNVAAYTNNRLDAEDDEVKRMLVAALSVARREMGWHVSPVKLAHTFTIDGSGSRILWLPTRKVVELTSITEDGTLVAPSAMAISAGDGPERSRPIALRKKSGGFWSSEYSAIEIVMDHGYTEIEAAGWRQAILSMVDQMSLIPVKAATGMSDFGQRSWRVDDVQVAYSPYAAMAEEVIFSVMHILDDYRLPPLEFL